MDVQNRLEENAIKLASIAELVYQSQAETTLGTVQGAIWMMTSLANEIRDDADRLRMKGIPTVPGQITDLSTIRQAST